MIRLFSVLIACLMLGLVVAGSNKAAAAPVETGNTTAELVSDTAGIVPGKAFWVALKLTPREGWHTYWRNPGDSGLPTTIEWSLPAGFSAGEIMWPLPHAVPYGPLMNFGYKDEHWLLVEVTPPADLPTGETLQLDARADWLVCEDICIPEGADLSVDVVVREAPLRDLRHSAGFRAARAALPQAFDGESAYRLEEGTIAFKFDAADLPGAHSANVRFFPYQESLIRNPDPQTLVEAGESLFLVAALGSAEPDGTVAGVITMQRSGVLTGFEVNAPAASFALPEGEVSGPPVISAAEFSVLTAVLYAFIGGLLLNLMPCVFPVLSLKALAVVKSAGNTAWQKRMEGFAYTAGVILSFLVVASVLLVFRAGGEAVGWGFQLQSTWFIGTLAVLLFAVGLNLSGYFEFGGRFIGIGQDLADRGGNAGAFFTGVLATIVATPCTAPFMATALGYALVQPAVVALSVFAALGLGLAFPFLLISAIPAFGKILPKPGPWMERFKQFLAFPMYGTVIWLIWVLGQQAGMNAVAAALAALMLVPFAIWAWRLGSGTRLVGRGLAFISMAGLVWLLAFANAQDSVAVHGAGETAADFEVYDPGVLAAYRAENMTVFVNFTAAWCITCLANEQVALSTDEVRDHFEDNGIRYLKADWTKRDPTITAALAEFGRNGVPLYVYYPAQGEPVVLPQLLTSGIVLDELKAADRQAVAAAAPN